MNSCRRLAASSVFAVGLFAVASLAVAGVVWTFEQSGGNVVGTMSGSIDTTGLILTPFRKFGIAFAPFSGMLFSGPDGPCDGQAGAFTSVSPFGPGGYQFATATTGDVFVIAASPAIPPRTLCLPAG